MVPSKLPEVPLQVKKKFTGNASSKQNEDQDVDMSVALFRKEEDHLTREECQPFSA